MSDITLINDSEQSSLVTNGLVKNGELYLKKAGSTNAGAIVAYDNGTWRTFANEAVSFVQQYSLKFDGTNEALHGPLDGNNQPIASSHITLGSTDAWTISFWYKNDNVSINDTSLFNGTGSDYFRLRADASGQGAVIIYDGGYRMQTGYQPSIDLRNWTHIAYTHNGSGLHKLFIDGSIASFAGYGDGTVTYTNSFGNDGWIYGRASTAVPDAYLDEVAILPSDLSSSISTLYNSGVAGDLSSLNPTYWYRMEEGSGSSVVNSGSVGSGTDLATSNSPTFVADIPS